MGEDEGAEAHFREKEEINVLWQSNGRGLWRRMDTCICMAESLLCSRETSITLLIGYQFSSVKLLSFVRLCDLMCCSMPGLPVYHQPLEFTQTLVHWVGNAIHPFHTLLCPSPTVLNLSQHQGLFKRVSSSHQVAKVLEFQLQISPSNEYSGLISFRMDWLDLLAVQGTRKSLLQHHSSKASILLHSAFFI